MTKTILYTDGGCSGNDQPDASKREMIAVAAQRVKPKELPPPERVFDFSFAHKVSDSFK